MRFSYRWLPCCGLLLVAACSTSPSVNAPLSSSTSGHAVYKVGQPYEVSGNWYYPHEDYSYDETGIASWYGADFHNQATANGEIYNKNELTAAHKTLPLPSLARVTNLENGRSIVVRVNDRGPFSGARIIDVSQRAAQLLGFEQQGTAKVRVQVLADESKAIADAMRHYGSGGAAVAAADAEQPAQMASNAPVAAVTSQPLEEVQTLAPTKTTPAVHEQLLATKPVAEYIQTPVVGTHQIYVQAGSFTVLQNATNLQQSLSRLGPTSISNVVINGTKFYRVRVGPITDVPHADTMLSKVRQSGIANARTIVD